MSERDDAFMARLDESVQALEASTTNLVQKQRALFDALMMLQLMEDANKIEEANCDERMASRSEYARVRASVRRTIDTLRACWRQNDPRLLRYKVNWYRLTVTQVISCTAEDGTWSWMVLISGGECRGFESEVSSAVSNDLGVSVRVVTRW